MVFLDLFEELFKIFKLFLFGFFELFDDDFDFGGG